MVQTSDTTAYHRAYDKIIIMNVKRFPLVLVTLAFILCAIIGGISSIRNLQTVNSDVGTLLACGGVVNPGNDASCEGPSISWAKLTVFVGSTAIALSLATANIFNHTKHGT